MKIKPTEKIKILLVRKGLTLGALADATGQSRQNLSNKFKRDNFSCSDLETIADALNCDLDIIFTDKSTGDKL